jgi:ABC-type uncharacterized transport system substrate-binding protein
MQLRGASLSSPNRVADQIVLPQQSERCEFGAITTIHSGRRQQWSKSGADGVPGTGCGSGGCSKKVWPWGQRHRDQDWPDHAGALGTRAAQRATRSIPILATSDDLVGEGFAASLAHPGGNITGISILAPELDRKRQEILLELVPSARHVAALADSDTTPPRQLQALEEDARSRNIELSIHSVKTREEIVPAIEAARAAGAQAINVLSSVIFYTNRALIIEGAVKAQLPAVFQFPEFAEQGALVGYGTPLARYQRQLAHQNWAALLIWRKF